MMTFASLIMIAVIIAALAAAFATSSARGRGALGALPAIGLVATSLVFWSYLSLNKSPKHAAESATISPVQAISENRSTELLTQSIEPPVNHFIKPPTPVIKPPTPAATAHESSPEPQPAWLENRRYVIDDKTIVVLSSKRWSTAKEAQQDVQRLLIDTLQADFRDHEPRAVSAWRLDPEQAAVAILDSYEQSYRQDLGSYVARMHRVHLQVELSPSVRSQLKPIWREQVVDQRLWEIGGLLSVITLVLGMGAFGLRVAPPLRGVQRVGLAAALVLVSGVGSISILRFSDSQTSGRDIVRTREATAIAEGSIEPLPRSVDSEPLINSHRSAEFFGIQDAGRRVAFVFEASNSMKTSGGLDRIRSELKPWLEQVDASTEFILVAHSSDVVTRPLTHDHAEALDFVSNLEPNVAQDSSQFLDAISRVADVRPDCIYVVVDDATPLLLESQLDDIAKAVPSNVRIHCIQLAADAGSPPTASIQALSSRFHGVYKRVDATAIATDKKSDAEPEDSPTKCES